MKRASPMAIALALLMVVLAGLGVGFDYLKRKAGPPPITGLTPIPTQTVYFNDSDPRLIRLGNAHYEVGLDKTNGGIRYITDKTTGEHVSEGDYLGNLWSIGLMYSGDPIQATRYNPEGPAKFHYSWSAAAGQLTCEYIPDPADPRKETVTVTVSISPEKWFDLQMVMQNDSSYPTGTVEFPSGLMFAKSDIHDALLPVLPGIVLEPGFFRDVPSYTTTYPGYPGVFADYMDLSSQKGSLAIYSRADSQHLTPVTLGFDANHCAGNGFTCYAHIYQPWVSRGKRWTSPKVRIQISSSRPEAIQQFRVEDGLDTAASLREKLGPIYKQVAESPLLKADAVQLGIPFRDYAGYLAEVPYPGLLHLAAYTLNGHDSSYPDFLPPDPQWGTTQDLAEMVRQAQSAGYLFMPYTNPTWWDEKSPTLQNRPAQVGYNTVVALDDQNRQIEECYGCPWNAHYGFVMSPFVDFVKQRLQTLNQEMTQEIPSNLLFEDQIGARASLMDYNEAAPGPDDYIQGWIDHTHTYAGSRLMTELGFDRLVETEVGFNGSALLPERTGSTRSWWGSGTWRYYPFVTMLARDKVLFYQHDLAQETFTQNPETLAWNAALGYMLSYDLDLSIHGGGIRDPWLMISSAFQRFVFSQYASERVMGYTQLQANITRTDFEHFSVTTNWDAQNAYTQAGYSLPPLGMLIQKDDGSFAAGVFRTYRAQPLSDGDHYLIVDNQANQIIVRQPAGADTRLTVQALAGWTPGVKLEARAFSKDGRAVGKTAVTLSKDGAAFDYQRSVNGQDVEYYRVGKSAK